MERREFMHKLSLAACSPLLLNGTPTYVRNLFDVPELVQCAEVSDRVLVIIRLAGANDGLNTVVPINQYDAYATLRPSIKLANTGTNSIINLDSTLPTALQTGLHPALSGFKSLYDSGKLCVINGAGYPSPNYSHFASENLMFAGKDGFTSSANLEEGWVGNYLNRVFPGFADNPSALMPDPLAILLGNQNPVFTFHSKEHGRDVSYNLNNLQSQLLAIPNSTSSGTRSLTTSPSEYQDLLLYIEDIQAAMDQYYNRIFAVYRAGRNSVTYPSTNLANQLKIVARLLQGGSKTRIFMTTIGGFDTHVNQVVSGSTHTGNHANLLLQINNAMVAFQNDLAALGLEDRVMTVSFSEFGRTIDQNGNLGTDHGNISPMFVVGKHLNPGVFGDHPSLNNRLSNGRNYVETERKNDYRQVYGTLLQDWLGASASALLDSPLAAFTSKKLPLIANSKNASPDCLLDTLVDCSNWPKETSTLIPILTDQGWTYYAPVGYTGNNFLIAVQHLPGTDGANSATITLQIQLNKLICGPHGVFTYQQTARQEGVFVNGYFFNISVSSSTQPNGWVNFRIFPDSTYRENLIKTAESFVDAQNAARTSPEFWFKTPAGMPLSLPGSHLKSDATGFNHLIHPLPIHQVGTHLGNAYVQFNEVSGIHQAGFASFIRVSNAPVPLQNDPLPQPGMIRFNPVGENLQGFNGSEWRELKMN